MSATYNLCLLTFLTLVSLICDVSTALDLKPPFRAKDILPLLPGTASWPILNALHSPVDILPSFIGAASGPDNSLEWKGSCFYQNRAWMEFHNKTGSKFGGGTLHIKVTALSVPDNFLEVEKQKFVEFVVPDNSLEI